MKKSKFFQDILLLALSMCFIVSSFSSAFALDEPEIECKSAILMNADDGSVYFSKNADNEVYPASLTKVMTLLLAVEAIENGQVSIYDDVTASSDITYDLIEGGSNAGIQVGETMSLESLLYCAALSSANEACNIIAEHVGGSIEEFIARMNERAMELGCVNTHFANAHGLPNDDHYTTANDYSKIVLEAENHELFREITSTSTYEIPATNMSDVRSLKSSNALINPNGIYGSKYIYEYATGIKTGYTSSAGYCLAASAEKDGIRLISVVFGGDTRIGEDNEQEYDNFADTITLFNWLFDNFSYNEVVDKNVLVTTVPVTLGSGTNSVGVVAASDISILTPNDFKISDYQQDITIYSEAEGKELQAPIRSGDVLGEMTLTKDGLNYGTVKLVAATSVSLSHGQYMLNQIKTTLSSKTVKLCILILILLFILYIVLVVSYRARRRKRKKAIAQAKMARQQRKKVTGNSVAVEVQVKEEVRKETKQEITPDLPDDTIGLPQDNDAAQEELDYFEEFFRKK